jgi:hypothetical protein
MTLFKRGQEARHNVDDVVHDRDSKQVSRFITEEIYQSKECDMPDNMHKAYKSGDRYYFNFPETWFNIPTLNKAIALRRVDARPRAYDFNIAFRLSRRQPAAAPAWTDTIPIEAFIHVRPNEDIETLSSNICLTINRVIGTRARANNAGESIDDWMWLQYEYDEDTYSIEFSWQVGINAAAPLNYDFNIDMDLVGVDFHRVFNQPLPFADASLNFTMLNGQAPKAWFNYKDVWNRRELFIHSSFVVYTSYGYLGRSGEFYTKPSKIYDFTYDTRLFYFQVSFDGFKPVLLRYENFIIEVSLILDSRRFEGK